MSAGLLAVFLGALGWAIVMGLPIECGCFGGLSAGGVGWQSLARNAVLIAMAAGVIVSGGGDYAVGRLWRGSLRPAATQ